MFFTGNTQVMHEQLWNIRGRHPVLWTVPFYVVWRNEDEAEMFPAVPLLRIQQTAVDTLMSNNGHRANGIWYVQREDLEKIGEITAGGDPEVYFSWERLKAAQQPQNQPQRNEEREAFLDALYQQGVGQSRDDVEFWWHQFCSHALDWLINKDKPIDMYFIRLIPAPFRLAWKDRVRKESIKKGWHGPRAKEHDLRKVPSVLEFMSSPTLLGLSADGTIDRFIEVEHLPTWWRIVKRVERTRLGRLQPFRYAAYVAASVTRFRAVAARLYAAWLAQKHQACATIVPGGQAGTFRLERNIQPNRKQAARHYVSRNAFKRRNRIKAVRLAESKKVSRKNARVPAVPAVQPPVEDLRNGGRDVPESGERPG